MSYSTITGISFDIIQNNLTINSVFASTDETGDDNNGSGDEDQGGSDETGDDNNGSGDEDQGGSDETGDDNNGSGDEEQLPANTASTTAPNTLITGVEQQLPADRGLSERIFDQQGKLPTQASCEAQGALFNPATGMCENKPPLFDPSAKPTQASCEAQGALFNPATGMCENKPPFG
jgi:hypothetical protein